MSHKRGPDVWALEIQLEKEEAQRQALADENRQLKARLAELEGHGSLMAEPSNPMHVGQPVRVPVATLLVERAPVPGYEAAYNAGQAVGAALNALEADPSRWPLFQVE